VDVNECTQNPTICGPGTCANTTGDYNCTCNAGYTFNQTTCVDINECQTNPTRCGQGTCVNSTGGFSCTCNAGYTFNGTTCVDVNECTQNPTRCGQGTCVNNTGGFSCTCNAGYTFNGTTCVDINECQTNPTRCGQGTCNNTTGGFTCTCNSGYTFNGTTCADNNECNPQPGPCGGATACTSCCVNQPGSYTCNCNPGFTFNGTTCVSTANCPGGCHANATCTNIGGGNFDCVCNSGWQGTGNPVAGGCTDINECTSQPGPCLIGTCNNTQGDYTCTCPSGYSFNGTACVNINECTANTDNCDAAATCTDTPGSFTCACPANQIGPGTSCMCDLNGTWALRSTLSVQWSSVIVFGQTIIAAGSAQLDSWSIRQITVTGGNQVQVDTVPCGGEAPDLCSPFFNQAFTQTFPTSIWQGANMPFSTVNTTITDPDPGEAFVTPNEANVFGMLLADPMGTFPAAWNSAGLTWLGPTPTYTAPDQDSDGFPGVTSVITTTGTSSVCGGDPYAGLPDPNNAFGARIDRVYQGSRLIGGYSGTIRSTPAAQFGDPCDVITGNLTGPAPGNLPSAAGRVRGCRHVGGAACGTATWQALDAQASDTTQSATAGRFSMVRVSNAAITCATVRGMAFPCANNSDCGGATPTCNVSTGVCGP
jgi:hypothetical protein